MEKTLAHGERALTTAAAPEPEAAGQEEEQVEAPADSPEEEAADVQAALSGAISNEEEVVAVAANPPAEPAPAPCLFPSAPPSLTVSQVRRLKLADLRAHALGLGLEVPGDASRRQMLALLGL